MLEYGPFNNEQDQMIADIAELLKNKYPHIWEEYTSSKEDNVITMRIVCAEEPIEVDEDLYSDKKSTVFDIDPEMLGDQADYLTEEGKQYLHEKLFTDAMPLMLGIHLLQCAMSESKAQNANDERLIPNGRSVSLMLRAMDELGLLVFHPRGDMVQLLTYIFGTWIEDDKHFLDYFYSRKDTKRVILKVEDYKEAIQQWLDAMK